MVDRHAALNNVLANAHIEEADPSAQALAAMRAWARSGRPADDLGELAKRAAVGLSLHSESVEAA